MKLWGQLFAHEHMGHAVKWLVILDVVAVMAVGGLAWRYDALGYRAELTNRAAAKQVLPARQVLEYAESVVRETKPAPTEAAQRSARK